MAQGREIPDDMPLMLKAYAYTLEDVPDEHLTECFKRAMKNKRDTYVVTAGEVNAEWDGLLIELKARAQAASNAQAARLRSGQGSANGPMRPEAWKLRHNLPEEWRMGQPFPPESDLHEKPVPQARVKERSEVFEGEWDASWHRRAKRPEEIYPTEEQPDVRQVRGQDGTVRTFVWYVKRCVGLECPGWIAEHVGPEGATVHMLRCPDHFRGQPEPVVTRVAASRPVYSAPMPPEPEPVAAEVDEDDFPF